MRIARDQDSPLSLSALPAPRRLEALLFLKPRSFHTFYTYKSLPHTHIYIYIYCQSTSTCRELDLRASATAMVHGTAVLPPRSVLGRGTGRPARLLRETSMLRSMPPSAHKQCRLILQCSLNVALTSVCGRSKEICRLPSLMSPASHLSPGGTRTGAPHPLGELQGGGLRRSPAAEAA